MRGEPALVAYARPHRNIDGLRYVRAGLGRPWPEAELTGNPGPIGQSSGNSKFSDDDADGRLSPQACVRPLESRRYTAWLR